MKFLTGWLLTPAASTYGSSIDRFYYIVLIITGVVFVLTEVALVWFSIRYRKKDGQAAHYTEGSAKAEIIWTSIPALIMIYLGLSSQSLWSKLRQPEHMPANAMVIKVMAEQWLWHFTYAGPDGAFGTDDDLTVDNQFQLPINRPVRFELSALDVIHGFYIPAFRLHQDAVPGMTSSIWVEPSQLGTFEVRCTQFCGTNHYQMKAEATVTADDEFDAWLSKSKAEAF